MTTVTRRDLLTDGVEFCVSNPSGLGFNYRVSCFTTGEGGTLRFLSFYGTSGWVYLGVYDPAAGGHDRSKIVRLTAKSAQGPAADQARAVFCWLAQRIHYGEYGLPAGYEVVNFGDSLPDEDYAIPAPAVTGWEVVKSDAPASFGAGLETKSRKRPRKPQPEPSYLERASQFAMELFV